MHATARRRSILSSLLVLSLLAIALSPAARGSQAPGAPESRFTVADLLDVINFNPGDLSDDGRWLAATLFSLVGASKVEFMLSAAAILASWP